MRKLKLLLAACALTGASAVCAQSIGDIVIVDGSEYEVTGENQISNGSFDDGVTGWYAGEWANAEASNYTLQTEGGFDNGPFLQYSAGGAKASSNIRGKWSVESGKMYLFRCYTSGKTPDSQNLQYSKLMIYDESKDNYESSLLYQLTWGTSAGQESSTWKENNYVFTATSNMVCFRSSWTNNAKLDGFFLGEVKRYISPEGYNKALQAANDALDNTDYANVTGQEKTSLIQTISDYTDVSSDKYEQAIEALEAAVKTFKDAKSAYDKLATANAALGVELPYADSSKKPTEASANTAEEATAAAASVYKALRAYYESNAMAEGVSGAVNVTELIKNPLAENGNYDWTWTGNKNNPASNEPWTDANNNSNHKYFDGGNWNGTSWTTTMSQAIALPAGKYLLTAKGRAATNTTLTMDVNGVSTELPNVGNTGNVFDRGWGDAYVEFETDGSDVTILVTATAEPQHEWFSISDFRLVRLEMYAQMADDDDYAALSTAIEDAEAKTLGFEDGNYAPYYNVEALQALAAAKAIDPTKENGKDMVNDLTNALTSATWTANSGEVDAIYDGQFANTEANTTSGDINLPGWTKVQGIRLLVKDEATDPGLAYTDGKAAVFSWGGTTLTYGEQAGYTLPMTKNEFYKLTLKVSGWRDGDQPNVFTVGLDGQTQTVNPNTMKIDTSEGNPFETQKFYLKPTKENSILTIYANHHFTIADLSLVKATPIEVTVGSEGYATYVTEAAMDFSATDIKAYTAKVEDNKVVLTQIEKVPAKTPVVLYYEGGKTEEIPFASETDTPAASDLKAGNGSEVATDEEGFTNYILNNVSGIGFYKAAGQTVAKEHAYLHVAATSEARLQIVFDGATAISEVKSISKGEAVYNLSGQRVNSPKKGLYIIGGKKAVLK